VECGVVRIKNMEMTQADGKRLEATEMWIWKRMNKISWVDKISNEKVLQTVSQKRKYVWLGHVLMC